MVLHNKYSKTHCTLDILGKADSCLNDLAEDEHFHCPAKIHYCTNYISLYYIFINKYYIFFPAFPLTFAFYNSP